MARSAAAARGTSDEASASVLGRGARVRGRIGGDGDLRVEGEIEGDVTVSGELSIEEGASIRGDVGAATVIVGGDLKGDVAAHGSVTIRATAQVEGNLAGAEVSLDEGASFHGRIDAEFDLPLELAGTMGAPPGPSQVGAPGSAPKPPGQGRNR
jgi:cytoskeletal protein CcmA (bactofilin family)